MTNLVLPEHRSPKSFIKTNSALQNFEMHLLFLNLIQSTLFSCQGQAADKTTLCQSVLLLGTRDYWKENAGIEEIHKATSKSTLISSEKICVQRTQSED